MEIVQKILKVIFIIIVIVAVLAITFAAGVGYGAYYVMSPPEKAKSAVIVIPKGETADRIAGELAGHGIIRNALLFRIIVRLTNSGREIKPGEYTLSSRDNMMEILNKIKRGKSKLRFVTIPEGLTVKQIAAKLQEEGIVKADAFLKALKDKPIVINEKEVKKPEGYLLPDTYDFPESFGPDKIILTMTDAFNARVVPIYNMRKDNLPVKLSLHEIVVLASMIEREARVPSERPKIARVYYNRLNKGMKLQCDATIQYALGKQKDVLTYADLEIKSPYNTYMYKGLPPGPIANPGIASIEAAINPDNNDYLFYVRNDIKGDGSHVFTKTAAEHDAAVRKYLKD